MALGKACPHIITIKPSHNMGFTVRIGCFLGVYPDWEKAKAGISRYMKDPKGTEKEYNEKCDGYDSVATESTEEVASS